MALVLFLWSGMLSSVGLWTGGKYNLLLTSHYLGLFIVGYEIQFIFRKLIASHSFCKIINSLSSWTTCLDLKLLVIVRRYKSNGFVLCVYARAVPEENSAKCR